MRAFARLGCAAVVAAAVLLSSTPAAHARQHEKRASFDCGEGCELRVSTNRLLELRNDEPDVRLRFGGRFHLDGAAIFDELVAMQNGWRIRRARPEFRARFFDVAKLEVDYELAPDRQGWHNVWARVRPSDLAWVQGDNFITTFGSVELGAHVSHVGLIDDDVAGDRATDVTVGFDWDLRQNLRRMFNYVYVDALLGQTLEHDRSHIVQGRFAVSF